MGTKPRTEPFLIGSQRLQIKLRCTVSELRLTLPSYAPPNWAMYAAPFWAIMHSLSYTLHRIWATPHSNELCPTQLSYVRCTFLSYYAFSELYAAPYLSYASLYRATPHPTELCTLHLSELLCILWAIRCTVSELRLTLLSYAPPNWAMYAAPFWATMHPISYAAQ